MLYRSRSDQKWLPNNKPQKPEAPPESPTTAKALDFDDETAETPTSPPKSSSLTEKPKSGAGEDVPPPKPPRPLAPEQQAENTLKEAFPSIDAAVIKAVLRASGGRVEPAFNALLGIYGQDFSSFQWILMAPRHVRSRCRRASATAATSKAKTGANGSNIYGGKPACSR